MEDLDLNSIPSKALNYSTRLLLGQYLNPEQILLNNGIARDYNGLAEEMGFGYNEIRNFQRSDNPTLKILDAWTALPNTKIGHLVQFLENIGRHDVLQDMQPKLENDAKLFLQRNHKLSQETPLQVPEVTSCRIPDCRLDDSGILTREDAYTGEYTMYDAFICYADEDIDFVSELAGFLESVGFKLFIRSRDMLAGYPEYETSMKLIKERCKRVLIVLSPDFLKCPACDVQSSFAAGLGIDEKSRKLIPLVYKPCEIPLMIKYISKIDFTRPGIQDWIWEKLISSLQEGPSSTFISSERRYPTLCHFSQPRELMSSDAAGPAITYPSSSNSSGANSSTPSITFPPTTSSLPVSVSANHNSSSPAVIIHEEIVVEPSMNGSKSPNKHKNKLPTLRFWKSPKKADSNQANDCSSSASMSYSNATSGFHSQGSNDVSETFSGLMKSTNQNNAF